MHKVIETQLFKLLQKREKEDGFLAGDISAVVNRIISESYPILQQVSRNFPLYTLHDPDHGFRVAENIYNLIPKLTLANLNSIEISILIYSAFFHDIGMASSQDEFYIWLESNEYRKFLETNESWSNELYRIKGIQRQKEYEESQRGSTQEKKWGDPSVEYRRIQDIIYTDYLRINHAERGAKYIMEQFGDNGKSDVKIHIGQVNYSEDVALVCKSHCANTEILRTEDYRRDLHIGQLAINLQYCSLLLRLADLIDLDPDRTPKVLSDFIFNDIYKIETLSPSIKKTVRLSADEWAKHRSILGYRVSPNEIRFEAKCSHPAIQKGLIDWCNYINSERINCRFVLQENVKDITEKYKLELINDVRSDFIKSDGSYIYADLKFSLDYERIVNLLMGTELWGDQKVVFRELLQNSIDACNHRADICKKLNIPYSPEIVFTNAYDEENNELIISCADNGIGMSKHIIETYLMQIGRSYYKSSEFKNEHLGLYPISQFGLGIMSCFMVTNKIRIYTQYFDANNMTNQVPLSVEIDSKGKYVVLKSLKSKVSGTTVSLIFSRMQNKRDRMFSEDDFFMREKHFGKGRHYLFYDFDYILGHYALHVDIPIRIKYSDDVDDKLIVSKEFTVPTVDWEQIPCLSAHHKEFIFKYGYDETDGLAGIFRFLLPVDEKGNLSFATLIEDKFKIFIDTDGDLCTATPDYKNDSLKISLKAKDDWDTAEIRGIYRDKFKRKPSASENRYDDLLEKVDSFFKWTQDGLKVDLVSSHETHSRDNKNAANLFNLVHVPGLNAAEIDIRRDWRTNLNVQRTDFLRNSALELFNDRYNDLAAQMWHRIIEAEGSFKNKKSKKTFIDSLINLADANWSLKEKFKKAFAIEN